MPAKTPLETWLRPNRRALVLGMAGPLLFVLVGGVLALRQIESLRAPAWQAIGWLLVAAGGLVTAALARHMSLPRIGYRNGRVLFYLRAAAPIAVPLEVVEGFLMGQGPVAPSHDDDKAAQTVTVVARLSQRAEDWAQQAVNPALAQWCDGYITIRGTWCEPLDEQVVRRLNRRLHEATKEAGRRE